MSKSNAELMVELWEKTRHYLIDGYQVCRNIDEHAVLGLCTCNVAEQKKRRDDVLYVLGQLDARKSEWKAENYNNWCFTCNQQIYFCRCREK